MSEAKEKLELRFAVEARSDGHYLVIAGYDMSGERVDARALVTGPFATAEQAAAESDRIHATLLTMDGVIR